MAETILISDVVTNLIVAGGFMGILGQGIRSVIGMKKLREDQAAGQVDSFSTSRLSISLFIGFVAGSLAAFVASKPDLTMELTKQSLLGFMAAGYAGTDFIEGFASRYLRKTSESSAAEREANENGGQAERDLPIDTNEQNDNNEPTDKDVEVDKAVRPTLPDAVTP